jgi:hypothetical protein
MIDAKYKNDFYVDYTNDTTGPVVRWNSNDRIPFSDMLQKFEDAGWIDSQMHANSIEQRVVEDRVVIENYRKNFKGYSQEDLFEMRAEFGAGAQVVNVLTGQEFTV